MSSLMEEVDSSLKKELDEVEGVTDEPLQDRRKTRRDETSSSQRKKDKHLLKQKIIIKRSPKSGDGEQAEFKAVTRVESRSPSIPSSPCIDDPDATLDLLKDDDDEEDEVMETSQTSNIVTPKHEQEMDTSLSAITMRHEQDTEDSCDQSDQGKLLNLMERFPSEESQASDTSGPPLHTCSLCNCGEKSLLGQGELKHFDPTPGFNPFKRPLQRKKSSSDLDENKDDDKTEGGQGKHSTWRRKRGPPKVDTKGIGDKPVYKTPRRVYSQVDENGIPIAGVDELTLVGHVEDTEVGHVFEKTGHTWAHFCCAAWSDGVIQTEDYSLLNVDKAVFQGLSNKCNYCRRYGATIQCKEPKCDKKYHYPCASGGGCFQDIKSLCLLCPEHTDRAEKIAHQEALCVVCDVAGNISEQLFCTSCGQHYHGNCLDPPVEVNPIVRAGWQCPECKICQTCRQPGDDNKMLVCDTCDKGYHTFCLRPAMTTIPKNGWKCKNCRVCGDCGARTPGNGPSSRWHLNFSVCDSCYQQRNKGLCCPICTKAYRQFTQKEMLECGLCKKFVHAACDSSSATESLPRTQGGKVLNYTCPICKNKDPSEVAATTVELQGLTESLTEFVGESGLQDIENFEMFKSIKDDLSCDRMDEETLQTSQDSLNDLPEDSSSIDVDMQHVDKVGMPSLPSIALKPTGLDIAAPKPVGPGRGKPPIGKKIGKKPSTGRPRGRPVGSFGVAKRDKSRITSNATSTLSIPGPGKIAPKVKIKLGAIPGTSSIAQSRWSINDDDDPKATTVICSIKDDFMVKQDMCMSCGSLGKDKEGQLISCTQCGQCYHPYCVDVKLSKVILEKGWRCLDCTVCEGCGQPSDEGRLILCDECDVSYHIYCLDPPLEKVPKGTWKCKWCVECITCGVTTPGFASMWQNNYSQCGKCASLAKCPVCENHYREDDSIIQCSSCDRWLHMHCDNLMCEDDAERAADYGYHCMFCRPITGRHGPLPPEATPSPEPPGSPVPQTILPQNTNLSTFMQDQVPKIDIPIIRPPPRQHLLDGVCLSDRGRTLLTEQAQKYEFKRVRGRRGARGSGLSRGGGLLPINRLLSTESKVSEEDLSFDDNKDSLDGEDIKPLLFPGDTPPHSGMDTGDILPSPEKEPFEIPGLSGVPPTSGRGSRGTRNPRMRIGMGVGGFIARSRARGSNLRGRGSARGSAVLGRGGLPIDPKKRRQTKKTGLEDSFPAYLQEAFFGRPILDNTDDGKLELNDEAYTADLDSGLAAISPQITSAIKLKDPYVFNEEEETSLKSEERQQKQQSSPLLSQLALTPRSNSQTDELQLSDGMKTSDGHQDTAGDSDKDIADADLILPDLDINNIFGPGNTHIFDNIDAIHESEHVEEQDGREAMEQTPSGPSMNEHPEQNVPDWLGADYDVDKKISSDIMELAHIDSKMIEDVLNFKEVLDHQAITSPNTMEEDAFHLPPLPSPSGQSQAQDQSQFQTHLPQLQPPNQQLHVPPAHSLAQNEQLHAPSAGQQNQTSAQASQQVHLSGVGAPLMSQSSLMSTQQLHAPNLASQNAASGFSMPQQTPSLTEFMQSFSEGNVISWGSSQQQQPSPQTPQPPLPSPLNQGQAPLPVPQKPPPLQTQVSVGGEEPETEHLSWNKKNIMKWEKDEPLGTMATISPVLYANTVHSDLKTNYPDWNERAKQIAKIWRRVPTEERAPFLDKARENRAANRRTKRANKTKLSQEVKRRNKEPSSMPPPSALPPGMGPSTPDGGQLPRIPSQEQLGGMSPSTGSQPHTPGSEVGTPVKPGTPVDNRTIWDNLEGHSPTAAPPASTVTLPSIQLKLPQESFSNLFKTPQLPTSDTRPPDLFADTVPATRPLGEHVLSHSPLDQQSHTLVQTQQHPAGPSSVYGTVGSNVPASPTSSMPQRSAADHHTSPASMVHTITTGSSPRAVANMFAQQQGNHQNNDPYGRPPGTPLPVEDPYAHPPSTPRTPQDPYARPPSTPRSLEEQFVHQPPSMPRTPQEQFPPRFPSPAPRVAVQFSAGQPRPQGHHTMPADPYSRPPMTPRGHTPPQRFPQQPPPPMTSDPYSQPPATPQGPGSLAEMHPEMQQMLATQRMPGPPHPGMPSYRHSYYGNRPPWPHNTYLRGEDKDNLENQQLRDLLAKQSRRQQPKKPGEQDVGSQVPLHHWPEDGTPGLQQQPQYPPHSLAGYPPYSQDPSGAGPPRPPAPHYANPQTSGPQPPWGHEGGVGRPMRPEMYPGPPRGPPHGYPPELRGMRPPPGHPRQPGFYGPPRSFPHPVHPGQMQDMRPQDLATPAERHRTPYLQMFQERLRSPQKDGGLIGGPPGSGPRMMAVPPQPPGDPRQIGPHAMVQMRAGMMGHPPRGPPHGPLTPPVVQRLPGQPQISLPVSVSLPQHPPGLPTSYTTVPSTSVLSSMSAVQNLPPGLTVTSGSPAPQPGDRIMKPGVIPSQPNVTVCQSNVGMSKSGAMIPQPGAVMAHQVAMMSQPGTVVSQPGLVMSQPGAVMSQPGTLMSQPGTLMSKPASMMSQPGSMMSQPTIVSSNLGMVTSQSGVAISQSGLVISTQGTTVTQPGMALSQSSMAMSHDIAMLQSGLTVPHQGVMVSQSSVSVAKPGVTTASKPGVTLAQPSVTVTQTVSLTGAVASQPVISSGIIVTPSGQTLPQPMITATPVVASVQHGVTAAQTTGITSQTVGTIAPSIGTIAQVTPTTGVTESKPIIETSKSGKISPPGAVLSQQPQPTISLSQTTTNITQQLATISQTGMSMETIVTVQSTAIKTHPGTTTVSVIPTTVINTPVYQQTSANESLVTTTELTSNNMVASAKTVTTACSATPLQSDSSNIAPVAATASGTSIAASNIPISRSISGTTIANVAVALQTNNAAAPVTTNVKESSVPVTLSSSDNVESSEKQTLAVVRSEVPVDTSVKPTPTTTVSSNIASVITDSKVVAEPSKVTVMDKSDTKEESKTPEKTDTISKQAVEQLPESSMTPGAVITSVEPDVNTQIQDTKNNASGNLAFQAEFLAFSRRKSQEGAETTKDKSNDTDMDTSAPPLKAAAETAKQSATSIPMETSPTTAEAVISGKTENDVAEEDSTVEKEQLDGCYDKTEDSSLDTDCDSEVEKIFDKLNKHNKDTDKAPSVKCWSWVSWNTRENQAVELSPIGYQLDGAGDEDKTNVQNQVGQSFTPQDPNLMYAHMSGGMQQVLGNHSNTSNPSSPAVSIKSPPGTPRTPKTPPGPKSPQRGHPLAGIQMHVAGQPMGQIMPGHPGPGGMRPQLPPGKGLIGQRPTTPLGHMPQGGTGTGGVPPGPTMGNPPPPYPVQQSSGKSPKSSQSPRPSPKPSPLQGQMIPSPHHVTSPHAVPSPHSMQSPLPGSRSTTPQMSPRGSHSGSQPGTPQGVVQHPGFAPLPHGGQSTPTGTGPTIHMGSVRMPIQNPQGNVPSPQAAMAQLASMAQGGRPPHPTNIGVSGPGMMPHDGSRPPHPHLVVSQGMMPPDGSRPPHPHSVAAQGMMPPGMRPPFPPQSMPQGVVTSSPSAVAAMLGQQRPGEMMVPQTMYRTTTPQPGQQFVMGGGGGPPQRGQFQGGPGGMIPAGHPPGNMGTRQRPPQSMPMMGYPAGGAGAPTSQHLPMQGMRPGGPHTQFGYGPPRGMHPGQPRPQMHPGMHPTSMPPGHQPMPTRSYTPGEVQIHTMPNLALVQQSQLQAPGQNMTTTAQAALSSLAQAHGGVPSHSQPGAIPASLGVYSQPASMTTSQVTMPGHVGAASTVTTTKGPQGGGAQNPPMPKNSTTSTTAASAKVETSAANTSSGMSNVLPESIAAILSKASKEQAELKAAAATQAGSGGGRTKSPSTHGGGSKKAKQQQQQQQQDATAGLTTTGGTQLPAPQVLQSQVQASMAAHSQAIPSIRQMPPNSIGKMNQVPQTMPTTAMTQQQMIHQAMSQGKPPPHMMMSQGGPMRFQGQPPPQMMANQPPRVLQHPGQPPPGAPQGVRHPGVPPEHQVRMAMVAGASNATTVLNKERMLLLNEQPLLLEELLEQEKVEQQRKQAEEQSKQMHVAGGSGVAPRPQSGQQPSTTPGLPGQQHPQPLLSDSDFEKLKVDVMADMGGVRHPGPPIGAHPQARPQHLGDGWHMGPGGGPPPPGAPPGMFPPPPRQHTPQLSPRTPSPFPSQSPGIGGTPSGIYGGPSQSPVLQSPQPAPQKPPLPPMREPQNDQERQQHIQYDQWLNAHSGWVGGQVKDLETKVAKHRKVKKSLAAKQRNARKNGNELSPNDQMSLASATEELAPLVKQLDSLRKQQKSHANTMADYKTKMQEWLGIPPPPPPPGQWGPPPGQSGPNIPPLQGQPGVGPTHMGPPPPGMPPGAAVRPPQPPPHSIGVAQPPHTTAPMQPRIPGSAASTNQTLRLPAQVRQEYENHMLQRIRQRSTTGKPVPGPTQPGIPTPTGGTQQQNAAGLMKTMLVSGSPVDPDFQHITHYPHQFHYQQDENNPFSDTYQQREKVGNTEEEQRQQIQRHIEQQQKAIQQEATNKQPPPYTTEGAPPHFTGVPPQPQHVRMPGPRMLGDTGPRMPGEAAALHGARMPGDMVGPHHGPRIPGDISHHGPRMVGDSAGHAPRLPGDISQHAQRMPSAGPDMTAHGIRFGTRLPGDVGGPRMQQPDAVGHPGQGPRMHHFGAQRPPFSAQELHRIALAPGENIQAGNHPSEVMATQLPGMSVSPAVSTVTSTMGGTTAGHMVPPQQLAPPIPSSQAMHQMSQAPPQMTQAPPQISQNLSQMMQAPPSVVPPPLSQAPPPVVPPFLSQAPTPPTMAPTPGQMSAPSMPQGPPPPMSLQSGVIGAPPSVGPPLVSPQPTPHPSGVVDKPPGQPEGVPGDKPKKKRKRKKKTEQQQQQAPVSQMQLPLDLDLQPMRMPSLPKFPSDFSLGSSPHTGLVPQSPIQTQPPSLPPHHHPTPVSSMGGLPPPHHPHFTGGPRQPHPPLTHGPGGMLGDKGGMSELEKLVNMQGQIMSSEMSKSQVAESMAALQHHIELKQQQQQHQQQAVAGASTLQHQAGVPISQPVPPQVNPNAIQQPPPGHHIPQQQQQPPQINISDLDLKAIRAQLSPNSQNMLLKQLLATNKAGVAAFAGLTGFDAGGLLGGIMRPPSRSLSETTEDADESVTLTPEQQKQLAMIENMPLTIEKDITMEEWVMKTPEEREQYLEAAETKKKRQQYDFDKEAAEQEQVIATPQKKKRRRKKDIDPNNPDKPVKKRPRKPSTTTPVLPPMKDESGPDFTAVIEQIMTQIRLLPRLPLEEPEVLINFLGMKDELELLGVFGYGSLEKISDLYCIKPYKAKPPTTLFDSEKRIWHHKYASPMTAMPWADQDNRVSKFIDRAKPQLPDRPELPSPPIIQPRQVISRASDKSPATIVDTSSPELELEDQKPQYPGLRLISHEEGKSEEEKQRECGSPEIPVMCPVPVKSAIQIKEEIKEEDVPIATTSLHDDKQPEPSQPSECVKNEENEPIEPADDASNHGNNFAKDVNSDAALGRLVRDPNEVSVTLTLNPKAADNIAGVMAAIADLLKIAVPATYEVSRSPSPPPQPQPANAAELFHSGTGIHKYKEEVIHLQNLLKSQPKFCRHCEMIVLSGGVRKKKTDIAFLQQDKYDFLDYGNEVIMFCTPECYEQFDNAQKNAAYQLPKGSLSELSIDSKQLDNSFSSVIHPSPTTSTTLSIPDTPDRHDNRAGFTLGTPDRHDSSLGFHSAPPSMPQTPIEKPNLRRKSTSVCEKPLIKKWKGLRYKRWVLSMGRLEQIHKLPPTDDELHEIMNQLATTMKPKKTVKDMRMCSLCQDLGCLDADGPGRLLNVDVDKYIHLNCALWSYEVYETVSGALMHVEQAVKRGTTSDCVSCHKRGATLGCFKPRCINQYHLICARKEGVVFFQDKTLLCPVHCPKGTGVEGELKDLSVYRKVYINREENRQVASIIHMEEKKYLVRVGSVIIQNIGQLLPHQIATGRFNTGDYIYPVSYKSTRYYWSYRRMNKRCKYVCRINDQDGWPEFTITVIEEGYDKVTHRDLSATGVWLKILAPYDKIRRDNDMLKMFPSYLCGEDLFGLTEPTVLRIIESLPGVELMANYRFKFGRSSLYKMPITVNPTGCARSEPKLRTHFKKPHTLHTSGHTRTLPQTVAVVTDFNIPYSKQFVHSKSQQYRRLKTEWRNNVYLRRSNVQGLGLFAARDLEKHTMVIEYIGEIIRNEVAENREKIYEQQHRGIYMFRIDDNTVVDATMTGGPARYINHSCSPCCVAEVVQFEKDSKIIIITKRRILKGEELTYDYKFDFEDDQHKIPCLCGATNCRKWMN